MISSGDPGPRGSSQRDVSHLRSCRSSFIAVMQSAHLGKGDHLTLLRRVDRARVRTIHLQRKMCAPAVVVCQVPLEDAREMPLVEHDEVIQTLTANTADKALHIWILPRRPG